MNIQFKQPKTLDGKQLIDELAAAGVVAADVPNIDAEGNMWIDIDEKDETKARAIVDAHIANTVSLTIENKLASVGLSVAELKEALGL